MNLLERVQIPLATPLESWKDFYYMKSQLHTTEHILFTTLMKKFSLKTKAMELRDDFCRVAYESDTDLRKFKSELENSVNEVIKKNLSVKSYVIDRSEASNIVGLELVPKNAQKIDVSEIIGFNKLACVGPHVDNTSKIGKFNIIKISKKGKNCYSIKFIVK